MRQLPAAILLLIATANSPVSAQAPAHSPYFTEAVRAVRSAGTSAYRNRLDDLAHLVIQGGADAADQIADDLTSIAIADPRQETAAEGLADDLYSVVAGLEPGLMAVAMPVAANVAAYRAQQQAQDDRANRSAREIGVGIAEGLRDPR